MRKIVRLLTAGWLVAVCGSALANPVDSTTARRAAQAFIRANSGAKSADLVDMSGKTPFEEFYVFSFNSGNGFVLVSGDDATEPILGYSDNGRFVVEDMPPHIMSWLRGYEEAIRINKANAASSKGAHPEWAQLLGGSAKGEKAIVGPFIESRWNQGAEISAKCPYDTSSHSLVPCGCTATATAQIMRYWKHPAKGFGSGQYVHNVYGLQQADYGNTTYNWDIMPDTLNANSTEQQIDAVSTVVYHIGVAVKMDYKPSGSGGKTASYGNGAEPSAENILKYNFGYSPNIRTLYRSDFDVKTWRLYLRTELDANRPILYAGYARDQSGHAFVIDGYMTGGKFHFNWGWGGMADGYFTIDALNPSTGVGNYDFNHFATATLGIEPYEAYSTTGTTVVKTETEGVRGAAGEDGEVTGSGTYNCGDTVTLLAKSKNEAVRFVQWSDGCRSNPRSSVATGGEWSLKAQFAPLRSDTVYYNTCDNSMERDSRVTPSLGSDSVWGIKLPVSALRLHHNLSEIHFMCASTEGTYNVTIYTGDDSPEEVLYTARISPNVAYNYSWAVYKFPSPIIIDAEKPIWIALKCTNVKRPAVFSTYGGNDNGMLVGENLTSANDSVKYSWMIRAVFESDGTTGIDAANTETGRPQVFPNPATDKLTVELPFEDRECQIQIVDCTGRVVREMVAVKSAVVDVKGLAYGVYFVKINNGGAEKFIKLTH